MVFSVRLSAILLLLAAGCASQGNSTSTREAKVELSPEQRVGQRAQARWDALLARDLTKAYGFITPGSRSTLPYELYAGRLDPSIWRKAVFKAAQCEKETCNVQVTLDYVVGSLPLTHVLNEQWLLVDGEWWFVYTPQTG